GNEAEEAKIVVQYTVAGKDYVTQPLVVDVVKVEVQKEAIFTPGTPSGSVRVAQNQLIDDGKGVKAVNFPVNAVIRSTDDIKSPGLKWTADVTLTGPMAGQNGVPKAGKGVDQITVGFMQHI